jgi:hypothetical protein
MRRREFIAGLGSAAAWPVVASGQRRAMPVIGLSQSEHLLPGTSLDFASVTRMSRIECRSMKGDFAATMFVFLP